MIKNSRQLALSRETLRRLDGDALSRVAGGSEPCEPHQTTDATQDTCNASCGGTCATCPTEA